MMRSVPYALVGGLTLQCGAPRIGGPWKLNFSLESGISGTKLCQKRNSNEKVLGKVYDRLLLLSCPYGMSLLHISVFTTHQCLYYTSFFYYTSVSLLCLYYTSVSLTTSVSLLHISVFTTHQFVYYTPVPLLHKEVPGAPVHRTCAGYCW